MLIDNSLTGTIPSPSSVADLTRLSKFVVTLNNLEGALPEGMCALERVDMQVGCSVTCPEGCCANYECGATIF